MPGPGGSCPQQFTAPRTPSAPHSLTGATARKGRVAASNIPRVERVRAAPPGPQTYIARNLLDVVTRMSWSNFTVDVSRIEYVIGFPDSRPSCRAQGRRPRSRPLHLPEATGPTEPTPPPPPPLPGWAPGASSWITASLNTLSGYLGGGNGVFPRLPSLEDPSSAEGRVGRHRSRSQPARLFVRSAWRLGPCRLTTDECPSLGRCGRRENVSARPTTSVATL